MQKYKFNKLKKSSVVDIKDLYIANYSFIEGYIVKLKYEKGIIDFIIDTSCARRINVTSLLIDSNNDGFYDIILRRNVWLPSIDYHEPLSKYTGIKDGKMTISSAKEIASHYFGKFNKENEGKPKRWEPKESIEDAIPYMKLKNSNFTEPKKFNQTNNNHSKHIPSSQGIKSINTIEDDSELTI